jgi:glutamyl-tRNA reductase
MSVLVVGMSHKSAPMRLLEQVALDSDGVSRLIPAALDLPHVREATVLSTCNRVEIYAEVEDAHQAVEQLSGLLCAPLAGESAGFADHFRIHHDDEAVSHLFRVASGLESMVVGECQILGQTREALRIGQELGSIGPSLNALFQQALRVGKRAQTETDIDCAGSSLISASLDRASQRIGSLEGLGVLVLGAGSLASVAMKSLAPKSRVSIANRTEAGAVRLANAHDATAIAMDEVPAALANTDLVVSCTGSMEVLITAQQLAAVRRDNPAPLTIVDLALPHDVDPAVAHLTGVNLISLATLAEDLTDHGSTEAINQVREIVNEEIGAFLAARRVTTLTPTLVALRGLAANAVEVETDRLFARLPQLTEAERAEVANAMRRLAEKLLHQPTVRAKELASETSEVPYGEALAKLFSLDSGHSEPVAVGGVQ